MYYFCCIFVLFMIVFLIAYFILDRIKTNKLLKISQKEWDEYSKGHDFNWKREHILNFVQENKIRHNWRHFYIPNIYVTNKYEKINEDTIRKIEKPSIYDIHELIPSNGFTVECKEGIYICINGNWIQMD